MVRRIDSCGEGGVMSNKKIKRRNIRQVIARCVNITSLAWMMALRKEGFGKARLERVYSQTIAEANVIAEIGAEEALKELKDSSGLPLDDMFGGVI